VSGTTYRLTFDAKESGTISSTASVFVKLAGVTIPNTANTNIGAAWGSYSYTFTCSGPPKLEISVATSGNGKTATYWFDNFHALPLTFF